MEEMDPQQNQGNDPLEERVQEGFNAVKKVHSSATRTHYVEQMIEKLTSFVYFFGSPVNLALIQCLFGIFPSFFGAVPTVVYLSLHKTEYLNISLLVDTKILAEEPFLKHVFDGLNVLLCSVTFALILLNVIKLSENILIGRRVVFVKNLPRNMDKDEFYSYMSEFGGYIHSFNVIEINEHQMIARIIYEDVIIAQKIVRLKDMDNYHGRTIQVFFETPMNDRIVVRRCSIQALLDQINLEQAFGRGVDIGVNYYSKLSREKDMRTILEASRNFIFYRKMGFIFHLPTMINFLILVISVIGLSSSFVGAKKSITSVISFSICAAWSILAIFAGVYCLNKLKKVKIERKLLIVTNLVNRLYFDRFSRQLGQFTDSVTCDYIETPDGNYYALVEAETEYHAIDVKRHIISLGYQVNFADW